MKLPPEQFAIAKWRGALLYKIGSRYVATWVAKEPVLKGGRNETVRVERQGEWPACAADLADGQRQRFAEAIESMAGLTL